MYKLSFKQKVFSLVKKIPRGRVTTYKEIANACGSSAYQAVGQCLKRNEDSYLDKGKTPCHRVVSSNGHVGGFFGQTSGEAIEEKKMLLEKEGVFLDKKGFVVDFKKKVFKF